MEAGSHISDGNHQATSADATHRRNRINIRVATTADAADPKQAWLREADFVKLTVASRTPPSYPAGAQTPDSQVAVAQIEVNVRGQLQRVEIVESPGLEFSRALESSVRSWKFKPVQGSSTLEGPVHLATSVIVYFIADGKSPGKVYFASDAPYVGPQRTSFANAAKSKECMRKIFLEYSC